MILVQLLLINGPNVRFTKYEQLLPVNIAGKF